MKKIQTLALFSAVALLATGFSACSSSDDVVANNPNYDPLKNEVKAQFVFNVSTGNDTRQSSAATQASEDDYFRGITDGILFAFKNSKGDGKHLAAATTAEKRYDMENVMAEGSINNTNKSHRVIETSLPINTNTLLFYGKAKNNYTNGFDMYGHLDEYKLPAISDAAGLDLSTATFSLGQRLTTDLQTPYHKIEDLLAGILTVVMNTNLAGSNHVDIPANGHPADAAHPAGNPDVLPYKIAVAKENYNEVYWASYNNADGTSPAHKGAGTHAQYPLETKLANIYREMTNITENTGELRSGSGPAILLIIHDLWTNVNEVRCADPMNDCEAVAKFLAAKISTTLEKFFTYTTLAADGHGLNDVAYKSIDKIASALNDSEWPASSTHTAFANFDGDLNGFPWDYNIPFGATHLRFDATKSQFLYVKDYNTSLMDDEDVGSGSAVTVENYCYPAELLYFGNSPIRVTNDEKKESDYPNGVANWDNDENWTSDWKTDHVVSTTHAVAMKNDINYGTALMKTTVKYSASVLEDNNHNIQVAKHGESVIGPNDEPNKQITVTDDLFKLTGIIIGGQVKRVGWDFVAKAGAKYGAYVYDRDIQDNGALPKTGTSDPTYTLLFDNYRAPQNAEDKQDKVYVALEFLNNSGEDFFGQHNLIRKDTHFYLIGELDPSTGGLNTIEWPTHHALPPYDSDGETIKTPRAFMQDYMTTADFVIGKNSLQHALLTVPDLRYSSLTLGLSVDLKWSTGLNFNNIILGGN